MTSLTSSKGGWPRLLTTAQASEYLWNEVGRTYSARLYRAAKDGRLTPKTLSGRHWWPLSALQKFAGDEADDE